MTPSKRLVDIRTRTDKFDLGYVTAFYQRLLEGRSVTRLLEIGVDHGESIRLWHDYFPTAHIYGIDIRPCPEIAKLERATQLVGNAYTIEMLAALPTFDVIIDDGPHTFESMAFFLQHYLRLLNDNGLMVLEDIIDRKWTPRLLEMIPPQYETETIDMRGRQETRELLARWQNGLDVVIIHRPVS